MSGRCSSCAKSFGFFNKEHGCFKCGFSFCGKCCAEKKLSGENRKRKVCATCSDLLSNPQVTANSASTGGSRTTNLPPPENLVKREQRIIDSQSGIPNPNLNVPFNDGIAAAAAATGNAPTGQKPNYKDLGHDWSIGLGPEDLLIKQRLQKLREEPIKSNDEEKQTKPNTANASGDLPRDDEKNSTTDADLVARVNALKGATQDGASSSPGAQYQPFPPTSKKLTQADQVDHLLQEIADEVEIDAHLPDPALDVENRLRKLRGEPEIGGGGGGEGTGQSDMNSMIDQALNWKPKNRTAENPNSDGEKVEETEKGDKLSEEENEQKENDLEAMNRLMKEMAREIENDADKEIRDLAKDDAVRQRLEELKEFNKKQKEKGENVENEKEDEEDEEETEQIIRKLTDEAKLEDHDPNIENEPGRGIDLKKPLQELGRQVQRIENNLEGEKKLPWCVICNEDASWSCPECDGDLYCSSCFREFHRDERHEPKTFSAKGTTTAE